MYYFLVGLIAVSLLLFFIETGYVLKHITNGMHAFLLFYLVSCFVNNAGYLVEMTSKTLEAAYAATRLLYVGKSFIALSLIVLVFYLCHVKYNKLLLTVLFTIQCILLTIIISNPLHGLYYSSIEHVNDGLFPHNVYGHGPVYYIFQILQLIYCLIALAISVRAVKKFKTKEEKRQIIFLVGAPLTSLIGLFFFMIGITNGFDTTNVGICIGSIGMTVTLFKYKLIDAAEMVKSDIIDNFNDGLCVVDSFGDVSYVNKSAENLFPGVSRDKSVFDAIEAAIEDHKPFGKDGRFYKISEKELYQHGIYRGLLYHMDDITEAKLHAAQLEEARDKATAANEAKSMFLSNMSHEIRTPMNAIIGMTNILLRNEKLDTEQQFYLDNIKESGISLLAIINDILDFSKIESGKMELIEGEYEPKAMLDNLDIIFKTRIGDKPLRLVTEIDENLPDVLYGDSLRIKQVLLNIMNNAIKYTDKGFVRFALKVQATVKMECVLQFTIQDTGMGIKEEELPKLFDSFAQMDKVKNHAKEGTGLGLSIAKSFIELMNGRIGVQSEYGKGTTFTVTIPQKIVPKALIPRDALKDRLKDADIDESKFYGKRILLVEDNKVNVTVAKGLFRPLKMEIDVAENGLIATQKAEKNEYDLILMDHMMPVMNGVDAAKIIRAFDDPAHRDVPIIALTANVVLGARDEFMAAGMNDMIGKPMNYADACRTMLKYISA